ERAGGSFGYALPVSNGKYTVVLHFAETYWTAAGQRVFDVAAEGAKVLTRYDIVKKVGPLTATSETFAVAVADGVLNLDFAAPYAGGGVDQAKISAIEVLVPAAGNQAPVANAGAAQTVTLPTSSAALAGSGTDVDGAVAAYAWAQVSGPSAAVFSSRAVAAPSVSGLAAGSYVFSLVVTDNQGLASAASTVAVTVNPATTGAVAYRINAGGPGRRKP
ncbi:malectin domain-containing carbohydrate-binding protein, partial [Hymenobacter nivis]